MKNKKFINFDFNKNVPTNKYDVEKSKVWRNGFVFVLFYGMSLLLVFCLLKC